LLAENFMIVFAVADAVAAVVVPIFILYLIKSREMNARALEKLLAVVDVCFWLHLNE